MRTIGIEGGRSSQGQVRGNTAQLAGRTASIHEEQENALRKSFVDRPERVRICWATSRCPNLFKRAYIAK